MVNELVSEKTKSVSDRMMQLVKEGKLRNHKLRNTSTIHHGDLEEQELQNYQRFLSTRNCYDIVHLNGQENYEEY